MPPVRPSALLSGGATPFSAWTSTSPPADGTAPTTEPIVTAVNLFPPGGIFAGNNNGAGGAGQQLGGHFFDVSTLTASGK